MSEDLWESYGLPMASYERDLQSKLSGSKWQGPHGFSGTWTSAKFD